MEKLAAECRLWGRNGRLKPGGIPESQRSAVSLDLLLVDFKDLIQREKCQLHGEDPETQSASLRNAFPYRLWAHSWAASNFFRRAEGFAGATNSCLPSVLTSSGVSGSILRRS